MEEEQLKKFDEAIKLSDEIMDFSRPLVKENVKALEIAEKIENEIRRRGAKPAWPVNICINEMAAHYTPEANDTLVLKADDLVKVDFGVQIDGCISDRAFTACIGKQSHPMIEASKKAVDETIKILKPGVKVFESVFTSAVQAKTIRLFLTSRAAVRSVFRVVSPVYYQ